MKGRLSARPPLERFHWIHKQLVAGKALTARDIAEYFEVNVRTVYRDIEFMRYRMDAPIEHQPGGGYVYSDTSYALPYVRLTEGELVSIFLAEKILHQYAGTPFEAQLQSAFAKICQALPDEMSVGVGDFGQALSFELGPARPVEAAVFQAVTHGCREQRRLRITYHTLSRDEVTKRTVDPYHVHNHAGDWFLIAFCHFRNAVRDFMLARILEVEATDEQFERPRDFDLQAYMAQSFMLEKGPRPVKVSVRFDAYEARWIRELRWQRINPEIQEHRDGSLTLHFQVTGLEEIKRWVLQYGSHATVLRPKKLRDMVVDELKAMKETYGLRR